MSRITPVSAKKRKLEEGIRGKTSRPKKKIRKQQEYHSSSEDEDNEDAGFTPVNLADSGDEATGANSEIVAVRKPKVAKVSKPAVNIEVPEVEPDASSAEDDNENDDDDEDEDEVEEGSGDDSDSDTETRKSKRKSSKRNDPEAFSTSISKILSTKLSQSARKDPLLSRSREAAETSSKSANERLEHRAKAKIRAEKKEDLQRGRVKDVLGLSTGDTGKVAEEEKRLRKIAQRGVVKLFNAVRAAQVRGEQAARDERKKGTIGVANREEKVNEMSKQGFLELISGKKTVPAGEES